jgi:hypothetical protein
MNIAGNFNNGTGLRLPDETGKAETDQAADPLGIHWEGPVMTGKKSADESRKDDAIKTVFDRPERARAKFYSSVEDYDPVLRSHCRLDRE